MLQYLQKRGDGSLYFSPDMQIVTTYGNIHKICRKDLKSDTINLQYEDLLIRLKFYDKNIKIYTALNYYLKKLEIVYDQRFFLR